MKIQMIVRESKFFVKVKCSRADEISGNAHSATSAFVNALAIAWGTSPQKAAETVAFQLKFMQKNKAK